MDFKSVSHILVQKKQQAKDKNAALALHFCKSTTSTVITVSMYDCHRNCFDGHLAIC